MSYLMRRSGVLLFFVSLLAIACVDPGTTRRRVDSDDLDSGTQPSDPNSDSGFRPRGDATTSCHGGLNDDLDRDGFTPSDGDCNDCSPQVNPAAFDDPSNAIDEDCDGIPASAIEVCDTGLALDSSDPNDAARAIGLCQFITEAERGWGVLSARWTRADGTGTPISAMQHGIMPAFGAVAARAGSSLLAISSGAARAPDQPGYTTDCDLYGRSPSGGAPAGLNPDSPACPGVRSGEVFDPIALEVQIRVPSNARGFRFESNFFTYEYPDYICSTFNDFFVVVMDPRPSGSPDGNIVFDLDGNKVSVNNSLLRACAPGDFGGRTFTCPLGVGPLAQTSYDNTAECGASSPFPFPLPFPFPMDEDAPIGASTGWLRTEVPVSGSEIITLRFAIWDAGDPQLDSLSLIDSFEWLLEDPGEVRTDPILF